LTPQFFRNGTGDQVGRATRRHRDDEANGLIRESPLGRGRRA
jgi:hypothetical protein